MDDRGPLTVLLILCVSILLCLLFPTLGMALASLLRTIGSRLEYLLISGVVLSLLAFEALFLVVVAQRPIVLPRRELLDARVLAGMLIACAVLGSMSFATVLAWASGKPVGPYW